MVVVVVVVVVKSCISFCNIRAPESTSNVHDYYYYRMQDTQDTDFIVNRN